MTARALGQRAINAKLRAHRFTKVGKIQTAKSGDYDVWVSEWGEPLMIPVAGPDRRCAEFILHERLQAVLDTKPD